MMYFDDVLSLTIVARSLFGAGDLIGYDDALVTTTDAPVKGVARSTCTEIGQSIAILTIGLAQPRAVADITPGQAVISAPGGVQPAPEGAANILGTALIAAAAGQRVTVLMREPPQGTVPSLPVPIDPASWTFSENLETTDLRRALWTADIPQQVGKEIVATRGVSSLPSQASLLTMTWEPVSGHPNGGRYVAHGASAMPLGGTQYAALGCRNLDGSAFEWITADTKSITVSNVPAAPVVSAARQANGSVVVSLAPNGRGRAPIGAKYTVNGGAQVSVNTPNGFTISALDAPDDAFYLRVLSFNANGDGALSTAVTVSAEAVTETWNIARNEVGGTIEIDNLPAQPMEIAASGPTYSTVTLEVGQVLGPLYAGATLIPAADVTDPANPVGTYPRAVRLGADSLPISGTLLVATPYLAYRTGAPGNVQLPSSTLFDDDFARTGALAGSASLAGSGFPAYTWGPDLGAGVFQTRADGTNTRGLYVTTANASCLIEVTGLTIPAGNMYAQVRFRRATGATSNLGVMLLDRADPTNYLIMYRRDGNVFVARKLGSAAAETLLESTIGQTNGDTALFRLEKTATGLRLLKDGAEVDTWSNSGTIIDPAKVRVSSSSGPSLAQNNNTGHRIQRLTVGAL